MRHLDEAMILAVRDGEPVEESVRSHLAECSTCGNELENAKGRVELIERTLAIIDRPSEITAAKAGVRARVGRPKKARQRSWGGRHLGKAAALLLATAGAAAAMPGSPLWSFLSPPAPQPVEPPLVVAEPVPEPPRPAVVEREPVAVGISVGVPEGIISVVVRGADPGSDISVLWTDEGTASLTAPAGSRFTYAAGRVEVDVSRGEVTVALPRDASDATLEVDGTLYMAGSREDLTLLVPVAERTEGGIRFRVDEQ